MIKSLLKFSSVFKSTNYLDSQIQHTHTLNHCVSYQFSNINILANI